jgi:hypothetical protein
MKKWQVSDGCSALSRYRMRLLSLKTGRYFFKMLFPTTNNYWGPAVLDESFLIDCRMSRYLMRETHAHGLFVVIGSTHPTLHSASIGMYLPATQRRKTKCECTFSHSGYVGRVG